MDKNTNNIHFFVPSMPKIKEKYQFLVQDLSFISNFAPERINRI